MAMFTKTFIMTILLVTVKSAILGGAVGGDATTQAPNGIDDSEKKEMAGQGDTGKQIGFDCDCEDDVGDSCNPVDEPCCFPLQCVAGRCARGGLCTPLGFPCNFGLNQCCVAQNQACQVNPANGQTICLQCPGIFQFCDANAPPGFPGSCCPGNACVNNICYPVGGK